MDREKKLYDKDDACHITTPISKRFFIKVILLFSAALYLFIPLFRYKKAVRPQESVTDYDKVADEVLLSREYVLMEDFEKKNVLNRLLNNNHYSS